MTKHDPATERLQMLWLAVADVGGTLRISKATVDTYPGHDQISVLFHVDPPTGDWVLECRKVKP